MKQAFAKQVLQSYQINESIIKIKQLSGGHRHQVWYVLTEQNQYVIKILSSRPYFCNDVLQSFDVCEKIAAQFSFQHLPILPAKLLQKHYYLPMQNCYVAMYDYVQGDVLVPRSLTVLQCRQMGVLLQRIHQVNLQLLAAKPYQPMFTATTFDCIEHYIFPVHFTEIIRLAAAPFLYQDNQLVISHRDLYPSNVVWQAETNPYIIDWELAGKIHPIAECLNSALYWSMEQLNQFSMDQFKYFIEGYISSDKNSRQQLLEKMVADFTHYFAYALTLWLNWAVYELQYQHVDSVMQTLQAVSYLQAHQEQFKAVLFTLSKELEND